MSSLVPTLSTSTHGLPEGITAERTNTPSETDHRELSEILYWSGLVLSRQIIPFEVSKIDEGYGLYSTVRYQIISAMEAYRTCSQEELRLAYYFYDVYKLKPKVPTISEPPVVISQRAWETGNILKLLPPDSPAPDLPTEQSGPNFGQLIANQSSQPSEAPLVQEFAALGLNTRPTTPPKPVTSGFLGSLVQRELADYPRSPAAERVPTVDTAENTWEAARRGVVLSKARLQQAQEEYDRAVELEQETFKTYSEARMNLYK